MCIILPVCVGKGKIAVCFELNSDTRALGGVAYFVCIGDYPWVVADDLRRGTSKMDGATSS